ncbi:phosphoenolpyruvate synthase [Candidatus Woesearchaeota archaeon]|nr:phosphoenolpyruvate synthase [Candidatus Woesearchaeota archaeon]
MVRVDQYIAWFSDLSKDSLPVAGGKGANLAEMYNLGLPVPSGFIITAQSFKHYIHVTGIDTQIFSILKNLDVDDNDALQAASEKVQQLILATQMPMQLSQAILDAYENMNVDPAIKGTKAEELVLLGREPAYVAVRSSATAEDLPSISEDEFVFVIHNEKPFFGKIKDFYSSYQEGDSLLVPSLENNEIRWSAASGIYAHNCKDALLYKITTSTGKQITVSGNHSLVVLDEDTFQQRISNAGEIRTGLRVPVLKKIPLQEIFSELDILDYVNSNLLVEESGRIYIKNNSTNWKIQQSFPRKVKLSSDFAYFLGLYCAEGSLYETNCVMVTNGENVTLGRVRKVLSSLGLHISSNINKSTMRIYCKTLSSFLSSTCGEPLSHLKGKGKGAINKKVPSFIFGASEEVIGAFLQGYFDGDGTPFSSLSCTSVSKELISGISTLLQLLGIEHYISEKASLNSKWSGYYTLSIAFKDVSLFQNKVGFLISYKAVALKELVKKSRGLSCKNGIIPSKQLSSVIRLEMEKNFSRQLVQIAHCPLCEIPLEKSSYYKGKARYYCKPCKKIFYENQIFSKSLEKYVYYSPQGRFQKGMIPWNKSVNTGSSYSLSKFKEILNDRGVVQIAQVLAESIIWDEIVSVEKVHYDGLVYDFTVPHVETFSAGFGGIVTHNTASFAGQQATYLNVKGAKHLLAAVVACWASLYTARAIYYRIKNNFPHEKVLIAVVIQKMVNADAAGVMFSVNPVDQNPDEILIEASYGLGEAVVSGSITPDEYLLGKEDLELQKKTIAKKTWMYVRDPVKMDNKKVDVPLEKQEEDTLLVNQLKKLGEYAKILEKHYQKPQDIEFAVEKGRIYITQTRPITTLKKKFEEKLEVKLEKREEQKDGGDIEVKDAVLLVSGLPASPGIGKGKVVLVHDVADLKNVLKGDVLVARMTTPDHVPAMQRASAIVTDSGGTTAHAAIVSRELGIPCIVGTEFATAKLKSGMFITVDAYKGKVYEGNVSIETAKEEKHLDLKTKIKVKVILDLPELAEHAAGTGADGVGLLRSEFINMQKEHPVHMIHNGRTEEFVSHLVEGLKTICKAFKGKPVWYRTLDARTDEFRSLAGGETEPEEDNPMMGWRSIRRSLDQPELLKAEFEAIKRMHQAGYKNLGVMLPLVTDAGQVHQAKKIFKESTGITPVKDIAFGVMVETPAAVQMIEELCLEGISFVSLGTNDLTQFTLACDRNSGRVAKLYDEMHPAVLRQIHKVIQTCKKHKVETSICGQAGSKVEMAQFLSKEGIDSISANADAVYSIRKTVARVEGLLK